MLVLVVIGEQRGHGVGAASDHARWSFLEGRQVALQFDFRRIRAYHLRHFVDCKNSGRGWGIKMRFYSFQICWAQYWILSRKAKQISFSIFLLTCFRCWVTTQYSLVRCLLTYNWVADFGFLASNLKTTVPNWILPCLIPEIGNGISTI